MERLGHNSEGGMSIEQQLVEKLPLIADWVDRQVSENAYRAKSVSELGFPRLGKFYSEDFLSEAKVVAVDKVQQPPIASEFGITALQEFEDMKSIGITYKDTYFLDKRAIEDEGLHCHELVHVAQWKYLGVKKFLLEYGKALLAGGYANNVFEEMARRHGSAFRTYVEDPEKTQPYDIELATRDELVEMGLLEKEGD